MPVDQNYVDRHNVQRLPEDRFEYYLLDNGRIGLRIRDGAVLAENDWVLDPRGIRPQPPPFDPPKPEQPKMKVKTDFTERTTRLPRFKMKYDSAEEMSLRLRHSIITIQDVPIYIEGVQNMRGPDGQIGLGYLGYDKRGVLDEFFHNEDGCNMRTPDPGYITVDGMCVYIYRTPARVYKQGLCKDNCSIQDLDCNRVHWNAFQISSLLRGLEERPIIQLADAGEIRRETRLSDRIAVRKSKASKFIQVFYKNNKLGFVRDNVVELKKVNPWVTKACNAVGIETKVKDA